MNRTLIAAMLLPLLAWAPRAGGAGGLPPQPAHPNEPLSVLTYNVHGLPWPIVEPRGAELAEIGQRLAQLRMAGRQPSVVVLQEAFTAEAARIGAEGGYRFAATGPSAGERDAAAVRLDPSFAAGARADKGETEGKWEGSGLRVFSDFPILSVRRMAFPPEACAGFDCLANKGALLVTIEVPGKGAVQVAATHLNSHAASGVPDARSIVAYRAQVALLDGFLRRAADPARPLIVAGDFNVGVAPGRWQALAGRASGWESIGDGRGGEALRACVAAGRVDRSGDAAFIIRRARDFEFFAPGKAEGLAPDHASVVFGRGPDGRALSDHLGFSVTYRMG
ncbi:endonuclease/exonuclease/phosphatase [Sphingomonas sp. MAH-20]|uniref:Endonuclease/exonuclease/phosphatase n=1 Tax=Sphingomonas horti TaxID=2682842 RepID=A0A6I4J3D2_9SPHN|nr:MULTISPECIES: endonuclease/exonuclease/phosphatase family protein [Sphingomonas]MBA2919199.1 endonuclease/exonuclease/phosphatase family protein [Sphingomonas sp. CGMCC 1.13658]MVO79232.1 endonuclease/exonuclease/phosphatase [Sphingomonas horti]